VVDPADPAAVHGAVLDVRDSESAQTRIALRAAHGYGDRERHGGGAGTGAARPPDWTTDYGRGRFTGFGGVDSSFAGAPHRSPTVTGSPQRSRGSFDADAGVGTALSIWNTYDQAARNGTRTGFDTVDVSQAEAMHGQQFDAGLGSSHSLSGVHLPECRAVLRRKLGVSSSRGRDHGGIDRDVPEGQTSGELVRRRLRRS